MSFVFPPFWIFLGTSTHWGFDFLALSWPSASGHRAHVIASTASYLDKPPLLQPTTILQARRSHLIFLALTEASCYIMDDIDMDIDFGEPLEATVSLSSQISTTFLKFLCRSYNLTSTHSQLTKSLHQQKSQLCRQMSRFLTKFTYAVSTSSPPETLNPTQMSISHLTSRRWNG